VFLAGGPFNPSGIEPHFPGVERADDRVAGDDAVTERAAFMRATVVGGEKTVAEVEDRDLTIAEDDRASFAQRKTKTPSLSSPSIGGIHARLPVASSSVSYGVTLPSSPVTVLASGSTSTMRTPTRRSMLLFWYHSRVLMVISSALFSPASTDDSSTRL
jgi:hypothetical protein